MVQSIFIKHSASQVAKKGAFGEIMPRISGFKVAHIIVRLVTLAIMYFLQSTTKLPKSHGSINFYQAFSFSGRKKGAFGEIMPRISSFQGGTYYCQTCHISNNVFSSKYHKIAKIAWFNQFLSSIQLLR